RWRDLDAFNHVNHVVFLTYLEEVRDEWLGRVLDDAALVWGYVIARVEIDYRRELTLEDDVVVARCSLERRGTKRVTTSEAVLRPLDRRLAFVGDRNPGQPRPREVLRPRSMVVVGIDLGRDLVRTPLPELMPHDRSAVAALQLPARLGVPAVTVHHQDPREPLVQQRLDDLRQDREQRGL